MRLRIRTCLSAGTCVHVHTKFSFIAVALSGIGVATVSDVELPDACSVEGLRALDAQGLGCICTGARASLNVGRLKF